MKAIITKYHGPTNFKGSRISACDGNGNRIVISYPHELSRDDCFRKAAEALCTKMKWSGELLSGQYKQYHIFLFTGRDANARPR